MPVVVQSNDMLHPQTEYNWCLSSFKQGLFCEILGDAFGLDQHRCHETPSTQTIRASTICTWQSISPSKNRFWCIFSSPNKGVICVVAHAMFVAIILLYSRMKKSLLVDLAGSHSFSNCLTLVYIYSMTLPVSCCRSTSFATGKIKHYELGTSTDSNMSLAVVVHTAPCQYIIS